MVKHTQTIRRLLPTNCLNVLDNFVELALKRLKPEINHTDTIFGSSQPTFLFAQRELVTVKKRNLTIVVYDLIYESW